MTEEAQNVWKQVMELEAAGKAEANGVVNTLSDEDLNTIIGTIDFFGGNYQQDIFDLKVARYRVFDWLAMRVQGRDNGQTWPTQVLVHSFIKSGGVPSAFVRDLQTTDYDIDYSYKEVKL
jgi:hypothetical protein